MPQVNFAMSITESTAKVRNLGKAGACVSNIVMHSGMMRREEHTQQPACWVQELDARLKKDTAGVRQEILQLCEGMKHIQLMVHGNDEVTSTFTCASATLPCLCHLARLF